MPDIQTDGIKTLNTSKKSFSFSEETLSEKTKKDLVDLAKTLGLPVSYRTRKAEIIEMLTR